MLCVGCVLWELCVMRGVHVVVVVCGVCSVCCVCLGCGLC